MAGRIGHSGLGNSQWLRAILGGMAHQLYAHEVPQSLPTPQEHFRYRVCSMLGMMTGTALFIAPVLLVLGGIGWLWLTLRHNLIGA